MCCPHATRPVWYAQLGKQKAVAERRAAGLRCSLSAPLEVQQTKRAWFSSKIGDAGAAQLRSHRHRCASSRTPSQCRFWHRQEPLLQHGTILLRVQDVFSGTYIQSHPSGHRKANVTVRGAEASRSQVMDTLHTTPLREPPAAQVGSKYWQ